MRNVCFLNFYLFAFKNFKCNSKTGLYQLFDSAKIGTQSVSLKNKITDSLIKNLLGIYGYFPNKYQNYILQNIIL